MTDRGTSDTATLSGAASLKVLGQAHESLGDRSVMMDTGKELQHRQCLLGSTKRDKADQLYAEL